MTWVEARDQMISSPGRYPETFCYENSRSLLAGMQVFNERQKDVVQEDAGEVLFQPTQFAPAVTGPVASLAELYQHLPQEEAPAPPIGPSSPTRDDPHAATPAPEIAPPQVRIDPPENAPEGKSEMPCPVVVTVVEETISPADKEAAVARAKTLFEERQMTPDLQAHALEEISHHDIAWFASAAKRGVNSLRSTREGGRYRTEGSLKAKGWRVARTTVAFDQLGRVFINATRMQIVIAFVDNSAVSLNGQPDMMQVMRRLGCNQANAAKQEAAERLVLEVLSMEFYVRNRDIFDLGFPPLILPEIHSLEDVLSGRIPRLCYKVALTGHGLAALMAEACALKFSLGPQGGLKKAFYLPAVTFESPGSGAMLRRIAGSAIPLLDEVSIVEYLSAPNAANTAGKHLLADAYCFFPSVVVKKNILAGKEVKSRHMDRVHTDRDIYRCFSKSPRGTLSKGLKVVSWKTPVNSSSLVVMQGTFNDSAIAKMCAEYSLSYTALYGPDTGSLHRTREGESRRLPRDITFFEKMDGRAGPLSSFLPHAAAFLKFVEKSKVASPKLASSVALGPPQLPRGFSDHFSAETYELLSAFHLTTRAMPGVSGWRFTRIVVSKSSRHTLASFRSAINTFSGTDDARKVLVFLRSTKTVEKADTMFTDVKSAEEFREVSLAQLLDAPVPIGTARGLSCTERVASYWQSLSKVGLAVIRDWTVPHQEGYNADASMDLVLGMQPMGARQLLHTMADRLGRIVSAEELGSSQGTKDCAYWHSKGVLYSFFRSDRVELWQHNCMLAQLRAAAFGPHHAVFPFVVVLRGVTIPAFATFGASSEARVSLSFMLSQEKRVLEAMPASGVAEALSAQFVCGFEPGEGASAAARWRVALGAPGKDGEGEILPAALRQPLFSYTGDVSVTASDAITGDSGELLGIHSSAPAPPDLLKDFQSINPEEVLAVWLQQLSLTARSFRELYEQDFLKLRLFEMMPENLTAVLYFRLSALCEAAHGNHDNMGAFFSASSQIASEAASRYGSASFSLHRSFPDPSQAKQMEKKGRNRLRSSVKVSKLKKVATRLERTTTTLQLASQATVARIRMRGRLQRLAVAGTELMDAIDYRHLSPERQSYMLSQVIPRFLGRVSSGLVLRGLDFTAYGQDLDEPLFCEILDSFTLLKTRGDDNSPALQQIRLISCSGVSVEDLQFVALLCPSVLLSVHKDCAPIGGDWKALREALHGTAFQVLLPSEEDREKDYVVTVPPMADREGAPLRDAVVSRNEEALRLLLVCGCEGTKKAMDVAMESRFDAGVELLLQHSTGDQLRDAIAQFVVRKLAEADPKLALDKINEMVVATLKEHQAESRQVLELLESMCASVDFRPSQQVKSCLSAEGVACVQVFELLLKGDRYLSKELATPPRAAVLSSSQEEACRVLISIQKSYRNLLKATASYTAAAVMAEESVVSYWSPVVRHKQRLLMEHFYGHVSHMEAKAKTKDAAAAARDATRIDVARQRLEEKQERLYERLATIDVLSGGTSAAEQFREEWQHFNTFATSLLAGWVALFSAYVEPGRCDLLLRGLGGLGTRSLLPDQPLPFSVVILSSNHKGEDGSLPESCAERTRAAALTAWLQLLASFMGQTPLAGDRATKEDIIRGFCLATELGYSPVRDPRFVMSAAEFTAMQHGLASGHEQPVADRQLFSSHVAVEVSKPDGNELLVRQKFDRLVHVAFKSKKMHKTARATALVRGAVSLLQLHFLSLKPWRVTQTRAQVLAARLGEWSFATQPQDVALLDLELLYTPMHMMLRAIVLRDASVQREGYFWAWLNTNQTRHQHWRRVFFLLCQLRSKALRKNRRAPLAMSATFDAEASPSGCLVGNPRQAHTDAQEELYCMSSEDIQSLVHIVAFLFALALNKPASDMTKSLLSSGDSILARIRSGDAPCAWHRGIAFELLGLPSRARMEYEKAIMQGVDTVDRAYNADMLNLSMVGLVRLKPERYKEAYGSQAATFSAARMIDP